MNVAESVFIIVFVVSIVSMLAKIYNVMTACKWVRGTQTAIITFVFMISHAILFNIAIIEHATTFIFQMFRLQNGFFWIMIMLTIVEIMIYTVYHVNERMKKISERSGFYNPSKKVGDV